MASDEIQAIDVVKTHQSEKRVASTHADKPDIEHAYVQDDPRQWSKARRLTIVVMICAAALIAGFGCNIYNPAISQIESDLHATSNQMSLTLSLFILVQGILPVVWSAVSEIQGRKMVYLLSIALYTVGSIVAALSKSIQILIVMRMLQSAGGSAVISIGAATLADLYEPSERGTMMGLYLCSTNSHIILIHSSFHSAQIVDISAPLLGPSVGPILGGALTQVFNWRAPFWFLVIFTGLCCISFIFFKDTFRKERSLTYQTVLKRIKAHQVKSPSHGSHATPTSGQVQSTESPDFKELKEETASTTTTIVVGDVEAQLSTKEELTSVTDIKLTLRDANIIGPMVQVLHRLNNVIIIVASALLFAFEFSLTYTASRTLANEYQYDALNIGLVLLAFGAGALLGSIVGGRYSDHVLQKLKAQNGGKGTAEARNLYAPAEHHAAHVCVILFFSGFFMISIYSSTLAYIVDANVGRSSSAVACNSCFRGILAFVAAEVAVPLQDSIGDGGLYSMWGGLMFVSEALLLLVWWKGAQWREKALAQEAAR
ncbi:uncharacterized protein FIBRA_01491 [Fibroporia radiculosa]|uniref:Major facilitator superfamily (MFS) profile domain-containing protein n=1 Tax=Fibroporia radiculosa TaxID=599839 RepID=J4G107_9APHY|nr:uncharacterized protein FIBRA_01491 [Fibroporia radiculosa]CCL99473.1 predicted protein [Fibroporia radiculosa]